MTLSVLADENIPALEHCLGSDLRIRRIAGRSIDRAELQDTDVLLVRSVTRVDEELLDGTRVRFVGSATSGTDHVDSEYLARRGIAFAHAPGSNANAVVEYVLTAIAATDDTLERLLDGAATVGIVGHGQIGGALAARLQALGIQYHVHDPWLAQESLPNAADLETVLACDVVSLHPELTWQAPWPSHHLLDANRLAQLRSRALLINTSRGPVIDNAALLRLPTSDGGPVVVLDVWEDEPAISTLVLDRVALGTAHIAGYSLDGKVRATQQLAAALRHHRGLPAFATSAPLEPRSIIEVPGSLHGAQLLRLLLASRYDIRFDDAQLRDAVALHPAPAAIAASFDHLRKTYRDRRELAGSRVIGCSHSELNLRMLRALGCRPL